MFVKIKDGQVDRYPYSVDDLLRDNPQTSFPEGQDDAVLSAYGLFAVEHDATPSYDANTHRVAHSDLPVLKDGKWVITKTVVELTAEEIASRYANHASQVRKERDKLLAKSDWTQMNDSPLGTTARTSWATYRQALRDITAQDGFPYSVTYPTEPEV